MRRSSIVPSCRSVHVPDSAGESAALSAARRRAFTLMELLIVVAVIAILVGLALAVGARVAGSGREDKTRYTIKALDQSLDAYIAATNGIPPPALRDPRAPGSVDPMPLLPAADAYTPSGGTGGIINSVGLYEAQCRAYPDVAAVFKSMDTRFLREVDQDNNGTNAGDPFPVLRTMFDAWDRPMRYVHPQLDGLLRATGGGPVQTLDVLGAPAFGSAYLVAELRRNNTTAENDSDGGICRAGRPYFYSAGADGNPATTEDNVYVTKPELQTN